jgi:hypothetical protein
MGMLLVALAIKVTGAPGHGGLRGEGGNEEEHEGVSMEGSPWMRVDGEVAADGRLGRRARSHGGGGAPVLPRPREGAEEARIDAWMLVAASFSSGGW